MFSLAPVAQANKDPYQWALVRLDYARKDKVDQLKWFCERVHELARRARTDSVLIEFLDVNQKSAWLDQQGKASKELRNKVGELRKALGYYYASNYLSFHDILFVDLGGNVLHTIRGDSGFQSNLVEGPLAETPLGKCLQSKPTKETFVDFHRYSELDRPAAFFVEPIQREGKQLGWLVLQCSINKVNSLFAGIEQLGETGEAFVVNRSGYMLTESNFADESTILKEHLDDRNIQVKFRDGQGHRTVTDYRGFKALTSFEVVEFLGTQWLVVVKVDEAQVTTEHFQEHRQYFMEQILGYLDKVPPKERRAPDSTSDRKLFRVDMDEFVKANHNELLQTVGVATCTALVASYPGKFGYLAHISPMDQVYGSEGTNLLGHVTKKIKTYDIPKYERRRVRFVIVAPHLVSLPSIIDKLVAEGFFLSQISVMYEPRARCANVSYDYVRDHITVQWLSDQAPQGEHFHHAGDAHNLGAIVKNYTGG